MEEIYEELNRLIEQGLSARAIKNYFEEEKGITFDSKEIKQKIKLMYEHKAKEEKEQKSKQIDQEIYSLREQGLSYEKIAKHFTEKGIKVSCVTIRVRCKKIYKEKGKEEPKTIRKKTGRKSKVLSDEEIYSLREQGLSYKKIAIHFTEKGIKVCGRTIRERCKKIYKEKGKEEPKAIRKANATTKKELQDEEIYGLREQELTYEEITKHFTEKGIKVSCATIRVRCKQIYKEKGKEEPKAIRKTKVLPDEEIYSLREQKLSYKAIAKYFKDRDTKISVETIRTRCKEIYQAKGKEEPKTIRKTNSTATNKTRKELPEEEIYSLNMQGFSYKDIAEYLNDEGIKVDEDKVKEIVIRLKHQKQKEIQIMEQDKTIYRLREQKLSYREIAEYFTKKGIMINEKQIRLRCKKIYEEKGEQEPKVKRKPKEKSLEQLEKELETLLLKKKKSQELLQRYIELEADLLSDIRKKKRGEGR